MDQNKSRSPDLMGSAAAPGSAFWRGFRNGMALPGAYICYAAFGALTAILVVLGCLILGVATLLGEITDRSLALIRDCHRVWRDAKRMQNA